MNIMKYLEIDSKPIFLALYNRTASQPVSKEYDSTVKSMVTSPYEPASAQVASQTSRPVTSIRLRSFRSFEAYKRRSWLSAKLVKYRLVCSAANTDLQSVSNAWALSDFKDSPPC